MELKTIQEVLAYWQEWITKEQPHMPAFDPEDIRGHIAHVVVNKRFEQWEKQYPLVRRVIDIAYSLDSPNFRDTDLQYGKELWRELKALIKQLEHNVNKK